VVRVRYNPQRNTRSDKLPPVRPHQLWPPPNNVISSGTHQGMNPLSRSEPSGSNHFPKSHQLATKPLLYEPVGYISYSNHNKLRNIFFDRGAKEIQWKTVFSKKNEHRMGHKQI
jgi:hypothetical protein